MELLYIFKKQSRHINEIDSIFKSNYQKNITPNFFTNDGVHIEQLEQKVKLDWLIYGKIFIFFKIPEFDLKKILFLADNEKGQSILDGICLNITEYDEILSIIKTREEKFNELDVFLSEHTSTNVLKNNVYENLIFTGKITTEKLLEKINLKINNKCEFEKKLKIYIKTKHKKYFIF